MRSSGLILLFILLLCAEILSVQDKHFIRMDSGESYVRTIDISRYASDGIIERISAVASMSFYDGQGEFKIVRLVKEIP